MAKSLDQRIKDAKEALDKAEAGSMEHVAAAAKVEELTNLKQDGGGFFQDDLNRIDKQRKDADKQGKEAVDAAVAEAVAEAHNAWKEVFEMDLEEAKQAKEALGGTLGSGDSREGDGGGGKEGDGNVFSQVQSALEQRDEKITNLSSSQEDFQRRYYTERVLNQLHDTLKGAGLQDQYLDPAKRLASYDELIEKAMKGEEVKDEEFASIAEGLKTTSPVWFEPEKNDDYAGIPPSPNGDPPEELTDQQRAERSAPVF